jgi:hypothetical protein
MIDTTRQLYGVCTICGRIQASIDTTRCDFTDCPTNQPTRLDKTLNKFKVVSPNLLQIELQRVQYKNDSRVLINYNAINKLFYFTTHVVLDIGEDYEKIVNIEYLISLNTVESLLKDLEAG